MPVSQTMQRGFTYKDKKLAPQIRQNFKTRSRNVFEKKFQHFSKKVLHFLKKSFRPTFGFLKFRAPDEKKIRKFFQKLF
jgi:hypothetical protein